MGASSSSARNAPVQGRKKVAIIGGGAAGLASAYALSKHPEKFEVQVLERSPFAGGVAHSEDIDIPGVPKEDAFMNDGVQGGCSSYRHVLHLLEETGLPYSWVDMMINFGKGDKHWTNFSETNLVKQHRSAIRRFGTVLKWVNKLEPLFVVMPIWLLLRLLCFSGDFIYGMVFPLVALFFGTGNQTPYVSSAIVARVFLDPDLRLFDYDSERLLSSKPKMFAFPRLSEYYSSLQRMLESRGVRFRLGQPVERVLRHSSTSHGGMKGGGGVTVFDGTGLTESFDEVIFACDASCALKMIDDPSRMERHTLGSVKYFNDVTVTHTDEAYMRKHYEMGPASSLPSGAREDPSQYFVKVMEQDPTRIEMSFDLSNYQTQLKKHVGSHQHVYQTIFLDNQEKSSKLWTIDEIDPSKVLLKRWWTQFSHSWTHYLKVIPFVRFIQGKKHSWFAGAYTLANTHEVATMSGLACAYRLGADYPFASDAFASKQFENYLYYIHGLKVQFKKEDGKKDSSAAAAPSEVVVEETKP